ncbi:hypothetical protein T492DRAFT_592356 [Pavlovales sp. CCMP2436]|nr:hypothetical protein T492DRAFT_592356 [Pavlovales sp. CCMP2436]
MSKAKLHGHSFWAALGSPRLVAAPMVQQSELPARMLFRRYGAELCYTPMYLAKLFCTVPAYRTELFSTCEGDRPLIGQLAGHDPVMMVKAGLLLQDSCEAIDINLGCPQNIARKGRYGAFLLPDVPLVCDIVRTMVRELSVPVTCKVRLLQSDTATLEACRRFEDAGVSAITVHGRTREQNKQYVGAVDWTAIRKISDALSIPVIANGGVATLDDVDACLAATSCVAVMSSEGLLGNPGLFCRNRDPVTGEYLTQRGLARTYMQLAREHGAIDSSARSHVFKLIHGSLQALPALRDQLAAADGLGEIEAVVDALEELDPGMVLEPWHHAPEGREPCDALTWYHRHPTSVAAREGEGLAGAPLDAFGLASVQERSEERIARRAVKAANKTVQRERAQERAAGRAAAAIALETS